MLYTHVHLHTHTLTLVPSLMCRFLQMEEGLGNWRRASQETESDIALQEFRQSRNSILCLTAEFFSHCSSRMKALRRLFPDLTSRCPELLDHKTHNVSGCQKITRTSISYL